MFRRYDMELVTPGKPWKEVNHLAFFRDDMRARITRRGLEDEDGQEDCLTYNQLHCITP